MGAGGRLVPRAGLPAALRRGFCAGGTLRAAVSKEEVRQDREDRFERGQLRAQPQPAPDPQKERHGSLCVHAPAPRHPCICVGERGRQPRERRQSAGGVHHMVPRSHSEEYKRDAGAHKAI